MVNVYPDNSRSIGETPLVQLNRILDGAGATVLAKIEGRNPSYSVKCRIGANMIWDAEKKGLLKGGKIVEATSGNTGIALAFVGAARGYEVTLTMPDTMSLERRKALSVLGAKVVLTPGADGMKGALAKAQEIYDSGEGYFMPRQFTNPANPDIHFTTTGPEIFDALSGKVDVFVSGVGTGGTISGVSRFLKSEKGLSVLTVAVEPEESPVISQTLAGEELVPGPHKIQGIGAGFIPENLTVELIDRAEQVSSDTAIEYTKRLAREEGLLCGISSGAAVAAAARLAKLGEFAGKTIVVILPDAGERYLSHPMYESVFDEEGLMAI